METFVHVVDTGSFSGAAKLLNIGQPSVSKSISQLEERLGVRLLHRTTRGLAPTEAGRQFYERVRIAIENVNEAELAARGSAASLSGKLRVSATVTFARLSVIPVIKPFLASHPDLDIDFILDDRNVDLLSHGVDVALRIGNMSDSGMTARRIGRSRRLVVGTPSYLAEVGEPQTPGDLESKDVIVYDAGGGGNAWQFRHESGDAVSVAISGRIRATAAEGMKAAVLADLGLAVMTEWMIRSELESAAVKPILTDWSLPDVALWAVFPTGRRASAKARAFIEFLEQHLDLAWRLTKEDGQPVRCE